MNDAPSAPRSYICLNGGVSLYRVVHRPSRRPSFNTQWFPLLEDVEADRAVVGATACFIHPGQYSVTVVLQAWAQPRFGKPGYWAGAATAGGVAIRGVSCPDSRNRDHVDVWRCRAHPAAWLCRWCAEAHPSLPAAARCSANCWDARVWLTSGRHIG